MFPDIAVTPRFALDHSGAVVNGDCYWITGLDDDLAHLILAVANSRFCVQFYDAVCGNRLYAGRRRWMTQYVERLPLPDPALPVTRRIVELARARCAAGGGTEELDELVAEALVAEALVAEALVAEALAPIA